MEKVRKEIQKLIETEREYLRMSSRKGSDIDFGMGKIRAYERVLELLK